jgi:hypothetical protein
MTDGLQCQWSEVFCRGQPIVVVENSDCRPDSINLAGHLSILDVMRLRVPHECKAEFFDRRTGISVGFISW